MLLRDSSYYQTGGTCDRIEYPENPEQLSELMIRIEKDGICYFVLGAGSNTLIMDDHWPGLVISLGRMKDFSVKGHSVKAEAGLPSSEFAEKCLNASLTGASWMYYLPGLLGSSIRMNARCYGGEMSGIVRSVTAVDPMGHIKTYSGRDAFLGYKKTIFMSNLEIITGAEFDLKPGDKREIMDHMRSCRKEREDKHQFDYPSCGCVFKNDYQAGVPSGMLLQEAGVRKIKRENVEISPYHANFVFNKGASAREILEVTLEMRDMVYQYFGIWLEYEMEIQGIVPDDLKERLYQQQKQAFNLQRLNPLRERFNA